MRFYVVQTVKQNSQNKQKNVKQIGSNGLNSNIRCIEIPVFRLNVLLQSWLNSNIRCIEIGKYMAWARQAEG